MVNGSEGARFGPDGPCARAHSLTPLVRTPTSTQDLQHAYIGDTAAVILRLSARGSAL